MDEYVGETAKVRFTCPHCHEEVELFGRELRGHEQGSEFFGSHQSVNGYCPKCGGSVTFSED